MMTPVNMTLQFTYDDKFVEVENTIVGWHLDSYNVK